MEHACSRSRLGTQRIAHRVWDATTARLPHDGRVRALHDAAGRVTSAPADLVWPGRATSHTTSLDPQRQRDPLHQAQSNRASLPHLDHHRRRSRGSSPCSHSNLFTPTQYSSHDEARDPRRLFATLEWDHAHSNRPDHKRSVSWWKGDRTLQRGEGRAGVSPSCRLRSRGATGRARPSTRVLPGQRRRSRSRR